MTFLIYVRRMVCRFRASHRTRVCQSEANGGDPSSVECRSARVARILALAYQLLGLLTTTYY